MMRFVCSIVLAVTLVIGTASAADKPVKGTIAKIEKSGSNTVLVVHVAAKKKDAAAGNLEKQEKRFTINSNTKVEKVTGKKGDLKHTDAKIDDLKEGTAIIITVTGDKVEKIEINGGKKDK
jgi:TolA-binding protein